MKDLQANKFQRTLKRLVRNAIGGRFLPQGATEDEISQQACLLLVLLLGVEKCEQLIDQESLAAEDIRMMTLAAKRAAGNAMWATQKRNQRSKQRKLAELKQWFPEASAAELQVRLGKLAEFDRLSLAEEQPARPELNVEVVADLRDAFFHMSSIERRLIDLLRKRISRTAIRKRLQVTREELVVLIDSLEQKLLSIIKP
ncbi:hypothetical protein ETAA8_09610 [Anatilimnocola aggregata]|uniref:Uncharacterized protein n=1 Tax=Anatilimnocola aggregata TaxID=2528021 RepID=A0A517Y6N1_9BACT|nr:hypothetical protein [Anatilimnocola aggregata]QDU25889.1 hypothetical protein ETAA8_09610 [Anatilimnocola aggregata]